MRSRTVPKPWGQQLWSRTERLLEEIEDMEGEEALSLEGVDWPRLHEVFKEARKLKKEMLAEETRRAM